MMFYDDDWREIRRKFPLIAKKIEELRCEVPSQEEHEALEKRVEELEMNGEPQEKEPRT